MSHTGAVDCCKVCRNIYSKQWRESHPESYARSKALYLKDPKQIENRKQYRLSHKYEQSLRSKAWKENNSERYLKTRRDAYHRNKEKRAAAALAYNERHREDRAANARNYSYLHRAERNAKLRARRLSDPMFRLSRCLRNRIWKALKAKAWEPWSKTAQLIGADYVTVSAWLTDKFTPGMSWGNHGAWHIDHVIPLSSAKTPAEISRLMHYTNLQPLWAAENMGKGGRILER